MNVKKFYKKNFRRCFLLFIVALSWVSFSQAQVECYALDFDGDNDRVEVIGAPICPQAGSPFTASAWFYLNNLPTGPSSYMAIFSIVNSNSGTLNGSLVARAETGPTDLRVFAYNNGSIDNGPEGIDIDVNVGLNANQWYHIAVVSDGTNVYLYLDGVLEGMDTGLANNCESDVLVLAKRKFNPPPANNDYLDGRIDDAAFWNTELTPGDISDLATSLVNPPATSIVAALPFLQAYYNMEEANGLVLHDQTANNYHGDLKGDMADEDWVSNPIDVTCPPNMTIGCWESSEPEDTGEPVVTDCPFVIVTQLDDVVEQEADCDQDEIIRRTWSIDDGTDTPIICEQFITIERIDINTFTFPPNAEVECTGDNTDISPAVTGEPSHPDVDDIADLINCEILIMSNDVELYTNCTGHMKIKREWMIMDLVCDETVTHNQIITIIDTTDPFFTTCPDDVTVNTNSNVCTADVDLDDYPAVADDLCTDVTLFYEASNGTLNPINNELTDLPLGETEILVIAEDDCDNRDTCEYSIFVEDWVPPTPICETEHTVSLNGNNPTLVPAHVFDDGSYDNCGPVTFLASRMDDPDCYGNPSGFDDYVPFYCCDVDAQDPIMVILQVMDVNGLINTCMVEVTVDDKIDPTIDCPDDITIDCWEDTSPDNTGWATGNDACGVDITFEDVDNFNNCNEGTITRTWKATDPSDNMITCVQVITIENQDPFSEDDITWPPHVTDTGCSLPSTTGEPEYTDGPCSLVGHTILSEWTAPVANGCIKIYREWIVFDECQTSSTCDALPGNPNWACWTYVQEITVMNGTDPVITECSQPDDFCSYDDNCQEGSATLTVGAQDDCNELNYFYRFDYDYLNNPGFDTDWTPDVDNDGSVTDIFDLGTHLIKWKVEDGCGNFSVCEYPFVVKDCKSPNLNILELARNIMQTGMLEVTAQEFDNPNSNTNDNCGIEEWQIVFPATGGGNAPPPGYSDSYVFDCDDVALPQPLNVEIWVLDINGNWASVITTLDLQDNNNPPVCNTPPTFSVSGGIENEEGAEVEYVDVEVAGDINDVATTGDNGEFSFNLPSNSNYTVTPERDDNILNGVSTYDLVLMSKHILQIEPLQSPYKIIAADINHSGTVSTIDLVALRKVILFIDDEFPDNTSWRFVDAEFVFPDPSDPFATSFPEVYTINGLTEDEVADFVGIKIGDINCSAAPNDIVGSGNDRNANGEMVFTTADQQLKAGETYRIDFNAEDFNEVHGFQFTLSFDANAIEFKQIEAGELSNISEANFGLHKLNEGIITASWNALQNAQSVEDGSELFSFSFTALQDGQLSDLISLNSRFTKAEGYDNNGLLDLDLKFTDEGAIVEAQFELFQNQPNPFKDETVVGFNLPESGKATFKVFDISGRVIKMVEGDFSKGYNEISINRSELQSSGVLYYQLESAEHIASKKMVLLD